MTGNDSPALGNRSASLRDNKGNVQTGDHATAVFVNWASIVTPAAEGTSPLPRRRETIGLPPGRRQSRLAGRSKELELITRAVADRAQVIVTGPPGSGKSTVVHEAALRLHAEGHPVVFLDVAGQRLGDLLQQVFEACYHSESYKPGPGRLRELLTGIEFCLVIDHLACSAQEWAALLQAVPHAVVVAAVPPGDLPAGPLQLIQLGGLDRGAALAMIAEHAGVEIGPHNLEAADAVWRATGGLPGPLVMAAAAATRGPGGSLDFPPVHTLPQPALDRLSAAEREIVMLLALAGPGGIAPRLLTELATISENTDNPLDWLTKQGLVTSGERDVRLVSGVADRLGPTFRPAPADAERLSSVLTSWAVSPATAPRAVADHAALINAVIDTAAATGHQGRAARLAKAASPAMAISLRYDAWEDILAHGVNAAHRAHDQATQAYLAHETGVLHLTTGAPAQAVSPLLQAAAIWDHLGEADLAADARGNLARNGLEPPPPVPARGRRTRIAILLTGLLLATVAVVATLIAGATGSPVSQVSPGGPVSPGGTASGPQPFVNVNKAAVQNGDRIIISGGGFKRGETVYIDFWWGQVSNLYQIAKTVADSDGDFGPITATIKAGMMGPSDSYSVNATGAISGFASTPVSIQAGGGATPPLVTPTRTPAGRSPVISALLPARFRQSCYSNSADVNTAAGEVAISECSIDGVEVTYTAFNAEGDLAASLNSLGDVTHPGTCTPQGNDLGIIDNTQPFGYSGHSGTVFCNYGNRINDSTIGWTDIKLPLILGVITVSSATSYEQAYSSWRTVLGDE